MDIANKTLSELKDLAAELGVTPSGDQRLKQTWISAIEAATCDRKETAPAIEAATCDRKETAPTIENSPGVEIIEEFLDIGELIEQNNCDCPACGGVDTLFPDWSDEYAHGFWYIRCTNCYSNCSTDTLPPCFLEDDHDEDEDEDDKGARVIFTDDRPPNRGDERGRIEAIEPSPTEPGITLSSRFLSLYQPPLIDREFIPDADGQLSLLEFVDKSDEEPPDFDDYSTEVEFWAAYDAWCDRNPGIDVSEFSELVSAAIEPIEIELASMREWAPCPDEWYEPNEIIETTSSTLEDSPVSIKQFEVMETAPPKFFIPIFVDRNSEDPPTAGSFARLPTGPKGFPPASSDAKFARVKTASGRDPPGGDAKTT